MDQPPAAPLRRCSWWAARRRALHPTRAGPHTTWTRRSSRREKCGRSPGGAGWTGTGWTTGRRGQARADPGASLMLDSPSLRVELAGAEHPLAVTIQAARVEQDFDRPPKDVRRPRADDRRGGRRGRDPVLRPDRQGPCAPPWQPVPARGGRGGPGGVRRRRAATPAPRRARHRPAPGRPAGRCCPRPAEGAAGRSGQRRAWSAVSGRGAPGVADDQVLVAALERARVAGRLAEQARPWSTRRCGPPAGHPWPTVSPADPASHQDDCPLSVAHWRDTSRAGRQRLLRRRDLLN